MADSHPKHPREGYGGTSEQRQRHLHGDNFSERSPRLPEELEETRTPPDTGGHVEHVPVLEPQKGG